MTKHAADTRDQLVANMKAVIEDTEELLRATAGAAGDQAGAARVRVEEKIRAAKERLADTDLVSPAKESALAVDEYVHENPWGAVGIAALTGLLVGTLISRR